VKHFKFLEKPKFDKNHEKKVESCAIHTYYGKIQKSPLAGESFHIVDKPFKAHLNVYFTDKEWDADILVYLSKFPFRARGKDEVWHYSDVEGNADTLIFPVEKPFMADIRVCIVENEYQARWLRKKRLKARRKQYK